MHWLNPYWKMKKEKAFGGTTLEAQRNLNYVRDLTNAEDSHDWKIAAVRLGIEVLCTDGTLYVRICSGEMHIVRVPHLHYLNERIQKIRRLPKSGEYYNNEVKKIMTYAGDTA